MHSFCSALLAYPNHHDIEAEEEDDDQANGLYYTSTVVYNHPAGPIAVPGFPLQFPIINDNRLNDYEQVVNLLIQYIQLQDGITDAQVH